MVFNDGAATSRRSGFPAVKSIAEQENTINKCELCVMIIKCVANISYFWNDGLPNFVDLRYILIAISRFAQIYVMVHIFHFCNNS